MSVDTQKPQEQTSQYEGTSNAEQITDVGTPQSNDSTVPTASGQEDQQSSTQAPAAPAAASAVQNPQVAAAGAPVQNPNATNVPANGPDANKQPLGKSPKQAQTQAINAAPMSPQQQQQVQKASVWHSIAETLAGGPRYSYSVDEYGNMTRQKQPVSTAHLALAVAMEALQGAAIGASQQGPNAAGKAAAMGFAAGQQRVQRQAELDQQQATEDYKNRMQTTETNMRMRTLAMQIGKQDYDQNQAYTGQFKPMADNLMQNYPGFVEGPVSYKDFGKYNATINNAIPYQTVPRLDENGKQVEINGVKQWDNEYLIVKPGLKATDLLQESDVKSLQNMGILPKGASADLIINTPMQLTQALALKSQVAQWELGHQTYDNYFNRVNNIQSGKTKVPENMATKMPTISNPQLNDAATNAAEKYNVPEALVKAVMTVESGGNPTPADSKAHAGGGSRGGAIGPMQVMPETAAQYGVTDPQVLRDPSRNIEIGTQYLSDLLNNPKIHGDVKLAAAAYIGGLSVVGADGKLDLSKKSPENKAAITDYINKVSNAIGLGIASTAEQAEKPDENQKGSYLGQLDPRTRMSLDEWNEKNPSTRKDNEKFLSMLAHTEGSYGQAIGELEKVDPRAAANMAAFLGGPDGIQQHDLSLKIDTENRVMENQIRKTQELSDIKQAKDEAAQNKKQAVLNSMEQVQFPPDVLKQDPKDVIALVQQQGGQVPPEGIRDAMAIARYDAPINIASNKLWYKDKSFNQQDMLNLAKILNPDFNVDNYNRMQGYKAVNSPASKTFAAAAGVSNHLNMLLQAAEEYRSGGGGVGQYPMMNKLANIFDYQMGKSGYTNLAALTNAVNGEMGKVLSGGFAPDKSQVDALMKNMTVENAYKQINDLVGLYTGVMHGKVLPYDEQFNQLSGSADRHLSNIPDSFNKLARKYNYETPWDEKVVNLQKQIPDGFKAITADGKYVQKPDGSWIPNTNQQSGLGTGNRAENFVQSERGPNNQI
jgi:hypothetical protein